MSHGVTAQLRLLATSDLHMHLAGWDDLQDRSDPARGLARLATRIADARAEAPGLTLLVDNGDALQGAPLADAVRDGHTGCRHPWVLAANALGYDAVGLGNHDFDYGLDTLQGVIGGLACPVLASTLDPCPAGALPHVILDRDLLCSDGAKRPLRIGLFSVLPPETAKWSDQRLRGAITFADQVDSARHAVARLRADGADVIIALAHSGIADAPSTENAAVDLAKLGGIDAMITGHTHLHLPGPDHADHADVDPAAGRIAGVPAVMPGFGGAYLGQIDLGLTYQPGGWRVTSSRSILIPAADAPEDTAITHCIAPARRAARMRMARPAGRMERDVHSYFDRLRPGPCQELLARSLTRAAATTVAGTEWADLPIIAAAPPYAAGGRAGPDAYVRIDAGPVQQRHINMLCPFEDSVAVMILQGRDLWNWMERSAMQFRRLNAKKRDATLIEPLAPAFHFDLLWGCQATIDPRNPTCFDVNGVPADLSARRLTSLTRLGRPVPPDELFAVATSSYRASGGGAFPGIGAAIAVLHSRQSVRDALITTLQRAPDSVSDPPRAWHFAPNMGAQVVFDTSPQAASHLDEIAEFAPEPLGLTDAGFLRLRLSL